MRKLFITVATVAVIVLGVYTYNKMSSQCDGRIYAVYVMNQVEGITPATQYACLDQVAVPEQAHDTAEDSISARIIADGARRQGHEGPYAVYVDGLGIIEFFNG